MKKLLLVFLSLVLVSCGGDKERREPAPQPEPQPLELCTANGQVYNANHGCLDKCSTDLINGPTNCFLEDGKVLTTNTYSLNCTEVESNVEFFTNLTNSSTGKVMTCTCKNGFEENTNGKCINPNFNFTCNTNELLHPETGNCLRECQNPITPTGNPCYTTSNTQSLTLAPTCDFPGLGGISAQVLTAKTLNSYALTNNQDYETITFNYCFPCSKGLLYKGKCIRKCDTQITTLNKNCYTKPDSTQDLSNSIPSCNIGGTTATVNLNVLTDNAKDGEANIIEVKIYKCTTQTQSGQGQVQIQM